jgi:hypothetical protein
MIDSVADSRIFGHGNAAQPSALARSRTRSFMEFDPSRLRYRRRMWPPWPLSTWTSARISPRFSETLVNVITTGASGGRYW